MKLLKSIKQTIVSLTAIAAIATTAQASLIDYQPGFPDIAVSGISYNYDESNDLFTANGFAVFYKASATSSPFIAQNGSSPNPPFSFFLEANIDENGSLFGNSNSLSIFGTVASEGFNSGTLLTADISLMEFNLGSGTGGDLMVFGFDATGGDLDSTYGDIVGGAILSSLDLGIAPGDVDPFANDFSGMSAIADVAVPEPSQKALAPAILFLIILLVSMRRKLPQLKKITTLSLSSAAVFFSNVTSAELLDVTADFPTLFFNSVVGTSYDAATDEFTVTSLPGVVFESPISPPRFIFPTAVAPGGSTFEINIIVDENGNLVSGSAGDDLVVVGEIDFDGDAVIDYTGVLLTAEVLEFGFQDSGTPTDNFNFRFQLTGGSMAPEYQGSDLAVVLTSESSNFVGDFAINFSGQAKGNLGKTPINTPPEEWCLDAADKLNGDKGHAIWLPGIAKDFIFDDDFGRLIKNADGTAKLTGVIVSRANPSLSFQVDIDLTGLTDVPPPGSPKIPNFPPELFAPDGPVDPATWVYYTDFSGTLMGLSDLAGAILEVTPRGPAFQIGVGANMKNIQLGASAWFSWVATQQPTYGHPLPDSGDGDINVTKFDCDQPPVTEICVDTSYKLDGKLAHAFTLPGIGNDFIFDDDFGRFIESNDGTASIVGKLISRSNPNLSFGVEVLLNGRTDVAPDGSPKLELPSSSYAPDGPIDPTTWYFYTDYSAILTGMGDLNGAVVELTPRGPVFQVGFGANGKNHAFGASSWFDYTTTTQPTTGVHLQATGHGDINVTFFDCCKEVWNETFASVDLVTVDAGDVVWSSTTTNHAFAYQNGDSLQAGGSGDVTWTTDVINIANKGSVGFSLELKSEGGLENSGSMLDYIKVFYKVDDGAELLAAEYLGVLNPTLVAVDNIIGDELTVIVRTKTTAGSESYFINDFALVGASLIDEGATAWSASTTGHATATIEGETFKAANNGTVTWTSEAINIANESSVSFSLQLKSIGGLEDSGPSLDYVKVFYKVDDGAEELVFENLGVLHPKRIEVEDISGGELTIIVETQTTWHTESYCLDNILVLTNDACADSEPPSEEECVSAAYKLNSDTGHALWLPAIATDFVFINDFGRFVTNPDGTALLTGFVESISNPGLVLEVNVAFSGLTEIPGAGSPKLELPSGSYAPDGPIDPSTWSYYESFSGTLTGRETLEGAVFTLTQRGPNFQVGEGASGKNFEYGGAVWLDFVLESPATGGYPLPASGIGDFNLDIFDCDEEQIVEVCAGKANKLDGTIGKAFWLSTIGTDYVFVGEPGLFASSSEGTAKLTGVIERRSNPAQSFEVEVLLEGFTDVPPPGSPKLGLPNSSYVPNGPIDTNEFFYYETFTGTLIGLEDYAGAELTITPRGAAFQLGAGANVFNENYGASAWFDWTVVSQPTTGATIPHTGHGDINIDFFDCDDIPCDGSISGKLYKDQNKNHKQDSNEPGLSNVTVRLKNEAGDLVTTTTDSNGYYSFPAVAPGRYWLKVPCEVYDGGKSKILDRMQKDLTVDCDPIVCDFRYYMEPVCYSKIKGRLYHDANRNGRYNSHEQTYSGVKVYLKTSKGRIIRKTYTDSNGYYVFNNVKPGYYRVVAPHRYNGKRLNGCYSAKVQIKSNRCGKTYCRNFGYRSYH